MRRRSEHVVVDCYNDLGLGHLVIELVLILELGLELERVELVIDFVVVLSSLHVVLLLLEDTEMVSAIQLTSLAMLTAYLKVLERCQRHLAEVGEGRRRRLMFVRFRLSINFVWLTDSSNVGRSLYRGLLLLLPRSHMNSRKILQSYERRARMADKEMIARDRPSKRSMMN